MGATRGEQIATSALYGGNADYVESLYEQFLADPASVERVDPDDLTTPFGPGYRIRRITLAITDDPVTETIERRLGWLPNVYRGMLPADFNPEGVPVGDYQRLFTTECCE